MLFFCLLSSNKTERQLLSDQKDQQITIKLLPDEIKFNGNQYNGKAVDIKNDQPIIFFGIANDDNQINQLKSISKTALLDVQSDINQLNEATNFNQFDAREYYFSEGITNSLKIKKIEKIYYNQSFNIINSIHEFRKRLLNYAYELPHPLDTYLASLFLGFMDNNINDELVGIKQLGLIHLFSISGLHVQYFVSVLSLVLIKLRLRREYYRIILMIFLPAYFVFAGSAIGLLRAVLTVEIGLILSSFHKRMTGLDIWSLTLIINLMIAPAMITQFGSQLSYALAFGLVFTAKFKFWQQTIFMNLISLPIIIFHVYEWHFLTLLANLLILPIFSILIFPIVIIGALAFNYFPIISHWIASSLEIFDNLINWLGALPGNMTFGKSTLILTIIVFILTLYVIAQPNLKRFSLLLSVYTLMFLLIHFPIKGEISYFDVGQGDSFLIREPFNRSVTIIDTGGKVQFDNKAKTKFQSERTSINYLKSIGINRIDNLCISHQDNDHSGDVPIFLQKMKVSRLLIPLGMENNRNFMNKIEPYLGDTQIISVKGGDQIDKLPLQIYHPFNPGLGDNHDSMVLGGNFSGMNWLFTGDLDQSGEREIMNNYPNLSADILKLGHHGSRTSTSLEFLEQLNPKIAIVSAGRNNRYNHPNDDVVQLVLSHNINIYSTQKHGMITYNYTPNRGNWITALKGDK